MTVLISGERGHAKKFPVLNCPEWLSSSAESCIAHHLPSNFLCDLCQPKGALSTSAQFVNELGCYEAKREESKKTGGWQESNPGHLWLELASALPLSHDGQTTTNLHNPLCGCRLSNFPLFSPHNIQIHLFPAWGKMLSAQLVSSDSLPILKRIPLDVAWKLHHHHPSAVSQ